MPFRKPTFCGFDTNDVKQSVKRLSDSKIELCDIPLPDFPEIDETFLDSTNVYNRYCEAEPLQNNEQTDGGDDKNPSDNELVVGEILENVVENVVQGFNRNDKACVDHEHNADATMDMVNLVGNGLIAMPADDPETVFFLSYS